MSARTSSVANSKQVRREVPPETHARRAFLLFAFDFVAPRVCAWISVNFAVTHQLSQLPVVSNQSITYSFWVYLPSRRILSNNLQSKSRQRAARQSYLAKLWNLGLSRPKKMINARYRQISKKIIAIGFVTTVRTISNDDIGTPSAPQDQILRSCPAWSFFSHIA